MAEIAPFGTGKDGSEVLRITFRGGPVTASVITHGASLQDLRYAGVPHALVLGADHLAPYLGRMRNYGANVGRVANRIAHGRAPLAGQNLELERNEAGLNTLHGGSDGAGYVNWHLASHDDSGCTLQLTLPDGQAGFPGALAITLRYSLGDDGALTLDYRATTDAPTLCNLAHHSYWNLTGKPDLEGHGLTIAADEYLPVDAAMIPLGPPAPVAGTRFDFRQPRAVLAPGDAPLDHNFCLRSAGDRAGLHPACTLTGGGLRLRVETTEPGLQVYDGAGLASEAPGHHGQPYGRHAGLALEPQRWPDAPNQPGYAPITLSPGETYRQISRFHVTRT